MYIATQSTTRSSHYPLPPSGSKPQKMAHDCMSCQDSDPDNECPSRNGYVCDDCAGECACCSLITCKACLNPPQCGGCSNAPLFDTYIEEDMRLLYCGECSGGHKCGTMGPVFECGMGLVCRCSQKPKDATGHATEHAEQASKKRKHCHESSGSESVGSAVEKGAVL